MARLQVAGKLLRGLLLIGAVAAIGLPAHGQMFGKKEVELGVNYTPTIANVTKGQCGCFMMNGGGAEGTLYLVDRLALVGDVSLVHGKVSGANYGLTLATYMAGPRLVFRGVHTKYTPYAQALFGGAYGRSVFPGTTAGTATSYAIEFGGGIEMNYKKRIGIRLIEADYLLTGLPNNGNDRQTNLKLATGIVFKFR